MAVDYSFDSGSLGRRIKKLREEKGITQEQLAEMLSIGTNMVSCYERGVHVPSNRIIALMCKYFSVSSDYLLYGVSESAEDILEMIKRTSDAEKMRVLFRLLFYFTQGKSHSLSVNADLTEIKEMLDRIFDDKG